MVTSAPTLRRLLLPLLFVAVCVVVAIGVWKAFGGSVPLEADAYEVSVELPQAGSVFANTSVRMAGVTVGRVVRVRRKGAVAELTLAIDPQYAPLHRRARAVLRTKTLLGEAYIEVAPGPRSAPEIADGGRLDPRLQTVRQQRLDDVLATFSPGTRKRLRQMFGGLSTAFAGRARDVNDTLGHAAPLTANLDRVLTTLDRQGTQLGTLVAKSSTVFAALGARSTSLERAVTAGSDVLDATASRDRALRATLRELPPFLGSLKSASAELDGASGDLDRAVTSLRPTVPLVVPALDAFIRDTPSFQQVFRQFTPTLRTARTALPAADEIVRAAEPAMAPTYRGLREAIPFLQLAAADRDSIVGAVSNMGTFTNGTDRGNGGERNEYGSIALTFWNEIVGGWAKKLPSNRANPYIKPRGSNAIASGGLKAYDCRNVHNPAVLPPIGFGAPDCKLQGPWTFQGKTAYYPRLELAAP